jgi:hypothetical protein
MTFGGKHLTKADESRRARIHAGNCMACKQLGRDVTGSGAVQVHHTRGKKRHDLTCGLCLWHHMGRPWEEDRGHEWCRKVLGPSLAEGSKPFHAKFGSDTYLLELQEIEFAEQRREAA